MKRAEFLALIEQGINDCEIARRTGIPRGTVRDWRYGRRPDFSRHRVYEVGADPQLDPAVELAYAYVLGLYLGFLDLRHVFLGLFLGFLLGSVIGVALIALGIRSRRDHIPFAPFLVAGAYLAVLFGRDLLDWYVR